MDLGGTAARVLQGSTAFSGIIAILIVFVTLFGYLTSAMGAGRRRSSGLTMLLVLVVGAIAVVGFLFPSLIHDLVDRFAGISSR